jgi:Transposase
MEATGVYWKPVFYVLERRFECWLLNAPHLHNVPGRKSDLIDSAWCCQLLEHALVRPSFVPPPEIRRLRDLTRLCIAQVEERTRAIQRLEKVLQDAGIKLSSVASATYSASARAMLEALPAGVSDPAAPAELAKARLRAKIPQLQEAPANRFELAHHGVLVADLLAHIDALEQTVATLDARIAAATQGHAELVELLCKAIAHYHIVHERVPFRELGPDWLARRHSLEHRTRRLVRQLQALGHTVTIEAAARPTDPTHTPPQPPSGPQPNPLPPGPIRPTTPPVFTPQEEVTAVHSPQATRSVYLLANALGARPCTLKAAKSAYGCAYRLVSTGRLLLQFAAPRFSAICSVFRSAETRGSSFSWTLNPKVVGSIPTRPTGSTSPAIGYVAAGCTPSGSRAMRSSPPWSRRKGGYTSVINAA